MIEFRMPNNQEIEQLREAFNRHSWLGELTASLHEGAPSDAISLTRLYEYVTSANTDDAVLEKKITEDAALRRIYRDLIDRTARYHLPAAMAASSEEFPTRQMDNFVLRMEASRAEPDQIYVIIEVSDNIDQVPEAMFAFGKEEISERCRLPEPINGVIQFISNRQSDLIKLLKNPKTKVKLL